MIREKRARLGGLTNEEGFERGFVRFLREILLIISGIFTGLVPF